MNMSREQVLKFLIDNEIADGVIYKIVNNVNFCNPKVVYINRRKLDDDSNKCCCDGYYPGFIKCRYLMELKDEDPSFEVVDRICHFCKNRNRCVIYMNYKCELLEKTNKKNEMNISFSDGIDHGESISYKDPYFEEVIINPEYTPCATKCFSGTQLCYSYPATPKCQLYTPSDLKTVMLQYDAKTDLQTTISDKMKKQGQPDKVRVIIFRRTWFKGRNNEFLLLFGDFMCLSDQFFNKPNNC